VDKFCSNRNYVFFKINVIGTKRNFLQLLKLKVIVLNLDINDRILVRITNTFMKKLATDISSCFSVLEILVV